MKKLIVVFPASQFLVILVALLFCITTQAFSFEGESLEYFNSEVRPQNAPKHLVHIDLFARFIHHASSEDQSHSKPKIY